MDFSCCILSQSRPTLLSHPEAATQVQQQILYLPDGKFRYESPPPSSLLPLLSGAELRETQGGRRGRASGGFTADSCFKCRGNRLHSGGSSGGTEVAQGEGIIAFAEGDTPRSACPASGN